MFRDPFEPATDYPLAGGQLSGLLAYNRTNRNALVPQEFLGLADGVGPKVKYAGGEHGVGLTVDNAVVEVL